MVRVVKEVVLTYRSLGGSSLESSHWGTVGGEVCTGEVDLRPTGGRLLTPLRKLCCSEFFRMDRCPEYCPSRTHHYRPQNPAASGFRNVLVPPPLPGCPAPAATHERRHE